MILIDFDDSRSVSKAFIKYKVVSLINSIKNVICEVINSFRRH